tara:strand:+ start:453 stop:923 length:471 start_codon:yes stop_codon:yes gene_type:complete
MMLKSLTGRLAALIGIVIASSAPLSAQSVSPSAAPVEWVRYAEQVQTTVTGLLKGNSEAALRFRSYVDGMRNVQNQQSSSLLLKVWITDDGTVSRIDFTPFAHEEANADLRSLIEAKRLDTLPPPDMLQPLHLVVELQSAPADGPVTANALGATPN